MEIHHLLLPAKTSKYTAEAPVHSFWEYIYNEERDHLVRDNFDLDNAREKFNQEITIGIN